jgi:glutamate synthase (NADPH/NADH) small chain
MPCTTVELDIAKLDGCKIIWLAAPKEITGENGHVNQLHCSTMILGEPDASGRRSPIDTGETIVLDVDMVIKAAGQMPFEALVANNNINNQYGKVLVDANGGTSILGVFAGGDCVNGGKEVVDAVQAGKDGAKGIITYLNIQEPVITNQY